MRRSVLADNTCCEKSTGISVLYKRRTAFASDSILARSVIGSKALNRFGTVDLRTSRKVFGADRAGQEGSPHQFTTCPPRKEGIFAIMRDSAERRRKIRTLPVTSFLGL